jgi:hypothetical protein
MATRANQDLKNALIKRYSVKNGVTLAVGNRVRFGTSDSEVDLTSGAADDTQIGTAIEAGVGNAAGSVLVDVVLDGVVIVAMTVGTGGSTRGVKQLNAANGVTDAPANGGGTTSRAIVGIAMQTGVVGDLIGVMPLNHRSVSA